MAIRIIIVDDSSFFRRRITEILEADPEFQVIDTAADGKEAVDKVLRQGPDVVTMDVEMPVMDGIEAVKAILARRPQTRIIMFSSLTQEGAQVTLNALEAGAADFFPKSFEDIAADRAAATNLFRSKVRALATKSPVRPAPRAVGVGASAKPSKATETAPLNGRTQLVVIAASTGGPVALQDVLKHLPERYPRPVLIVQHMPAAFTRTFAERLNGSCRVAVKEAQDGERLASGTVYIAPGGMQLTVERNGTNSTLKVYAGQDGLNYKPCADLTLSSLAGQRADDVLVVVLTGMGADGCEGARKLKQMGATVWAQDEASCVVYGMPAAVTKAGLTDHVLSLDAIGVSLSQGK
jgi:two-component system chemotaxis response regulator CheB